jgi:hypothetical protein
MSDVRSAELIGVAQPIARCGEVGGIGSRGRIAERGMQALAVVVADPYTGSLQTRHSSALNRQSSHLPLASCSTPLQKAGLQLQLEQIGRGRSMKQIADDLLDFRKIMEIMAVVVVGLLKAALRKMSRSTRSTSVLIACEYESQVMTTKTASITSTMVMAPIRKNTICAVDATGSLRWLPICAASPPNRHRRSIASRHRPWRRRTC